LVVAAVVVEQQGSAMSLQDQLVDNDPYILYDQSLNLAPNLAENNPLDSETSTSLPYWSEPQIFERTLSNKVVRSPSRFGLFTSMEVMLTSTVIFKFRLFSRTSAEFEIRALLKTSDTALNKFSRTTFVKHLST
jgi:hypothetical protein